MAATGARLRQLREAYGFATTRAFAAELGVTEDAMHLYEVGKRLPPVHLASRLKARFGVTLDWLYDGDASTLPRHVWADLSKGRSVS